MKKHHTISASSLIGKTNLIRKIGRLSLTRETVRFLTTGELFLVAGAGSGGNNTESLVEDGTSCVSQ